MQGAATRTSGIFRAVRDDVFLSDVRSSLRGLGPRTGRKATAASAQRLLAAVLRLLEGVLEPLLPDHGFFVIVG